MPLEVRTLPLVPGATACNAEVPLPSKTLLAVNVVEPVPPFATPNVPVTPVDKGSPVALVRVPLDGVPNAPPLTTKAPAEPTATPRAVVTPVPVVIVDGAAPAPPPTMMALAVRAAEDAHVDALEKYGTPPLVPATVRAKVPLVVIGEPETEIRPPVND